MPPVALFLFFISGFLFHALDLLKFLGCPTRRPAHFIGLAHRTTSSLGLVNFHQVSCQLMVERQRVELCEPKRQVYSLPRLRSGLALRLIGPAPWNRTRLYPVYKTRLDPETHIQGVHIIGRDIVVPASFHLASGEQCRSAKRRGTDLP